MPTLVEALQEYAEPLPEWLDGDGNPAFDRQRFFSSRTVYYPGWGDDGHPVKLCAESRAAHAFVYVDYRVSEEQVMARVNHPERGFRGYEVTHTEHIEEETLRPGGWAPRLAPDEIMNANAFRNSFVTPFARFYGLTRKAGYGGDHGPRRLAVLFVGGDGFATYDALYCQRDGTRAPFMILAQDHGFGGNWASFGRDGVPGHRAGLLERLAERCGVWPDLLLVADNTEPWRSYNDVGAEADRGGMHAHPRKLFRRRTA